MPPTLSTGNADTYSLVDIDFGFMGTSLSATFQMLDKVIPAATFVELQVHDKIKHIAGLIPASPVPSSDLYFTFHGEGETDGKKKIRFCSTNREERRKYITESIHLYTLVSEKFPSGKIRRLILHPDSIHKGPSRNVQISILADSLIALSDGLKAALDCEVCIEPRGTTRHGKVLRIEIDDLQLLNDLLKENGSKIGLCIDVAQMFIVHGNFGSSELLQALRTFHIPVREFHVSDVVQNRKIVNRVGMEVGSGAISWKILLPLMFALNQSLLIETLGGFNVYSRSKSFLTSLLDNEHEEVLL